MPLPVDDYRFLRPRPADSFMYLKTMEIRWFILISLMIKAILCQAKICARHGQQMLPREGFPFGHGAYIFLFSSCFSFFSISANRSFFFWACWALIFSIFCEIPFWDSLNFLISSSRLLPSSSRGISSIFK